MHFMHDIATLAKMRRFFALVSLTIDNIKTFAMCMNDAMQKIAKNIWESSERERKLHILEFPRSNINFVGIGLGCMHIGLCVFLASSLSSSEKGKSI